VGKKIRCKHCCKCFTYVGRPEELHDAMTVQGELDGEFTLELIDVDAPPTPVVADAPETTVAPSRIAPARVAPAEAAWSPHWGERSSDRPPGLADQASMRKTCTACRSEVPPESKPGDICPHCGKYWSSERRDIMDIYRESLEREIRRLEGRP
jgi:hypothetical protein